MESVKEQRICIELCFTVRKADAKTHDMLLEPSDASSQKVTHKWFTCFKKGRTSMGLANFNSRIQPG
jgi:hypothetical protein